MFFFFSLSLHFLLSSIVSVNRHQKFVTRSVMPSLTSPAISAVCYSLYFSLSTYISFSRFLFAFLSSLFPLVLLLSSLHTDQVAVSSPGGSEPPHFWPELLQRLWLCIQSPTPILRESALRIFRCSSLYSLLIFFWFLLSSRLCFMIYFPVHA